MGGGYQHRLWWNANILGHSADANPLSPYFADTTVLLFLQSLGATIGSFLALNSCPSLTKKFFFWVKTKKESNTFLWFVSLLYGVRPHPLPLSGARSQTKASFFGVSEGDRIGLRCYLLLYKTGFRADSGTIKTRLRNTVYFCIRSSRDRLRFELKI